jgi:multiple sugar transport system substrate-binding protein
MDVAAYAVNIFIRRRKMKKGTAVIAVLLLVMVFMPAFVFAGGARSNSAAASNKTISMYIWGQETSMRRIAEEYTRASGVKVEFTLSPYSEHWTKLQASLPSGNGPDVFWCNYSHAKDYYPAGLVQEIQSYIERDKVDMSPFPKALIEMYSYQGKIYGLPKDYDTIGLFYNKEIFDAKGYPYPTNNWTWDDYRRAAIALTDPLKNIYGTAFPEDEQAVVYPFVFSNQGTVLSADNRSFSLNNPGAIEALQWITGIILRDRAAPTHEEMRELSATERFQAGLIAMLPAGDWSVPDFYPILGDKMGVARLPISKVEGNDIHGLSFNINARSANKEEAWGLVKAFSTQSAGEIMAAEVIPAYEGSTPIWKNHWPNMDLQIFIDAAKISQPYATPVIAASDQFSAMYTMYEKIWTGADISSTLRAFDEECRRLADAASR